MSDLVKQLRNLIIVDGADDDAPLGRLAADEIERLQDRCAAYKGQIEAGAKEIERLRAALGPFADVEPDLHDKAEDRDHLWESPAAMGLTAGHIRAAREALKLE